MGGARSPVGWTDGERPVFPEGGGDEGPEGRDREGEGVEGEGVCEWKMKLSKGFW
jgi:hypothetical protein